MRKFYIHYAKDKTSILEVEIEEVFDLWLKPTEYKAKVLAPACLLDKSPTGQLKPPVFYSHAFYDEVYEAMISLRKDTIALFERNKIKHGTSFTEEDVDKHLSTIDTIML